MRAGGVNINGPQCGGNLNRQRQKYLDGQAGMKILVYIARWTSVISEEVCDMGSYRTRRQPSLITLVHRAIYTIITLG